MTQLTKAKNEMEYERRQSEREHKQRMSEQKSELQQEYSTKLDKMQKDAAVEKESHRKELRTNLEKQIKQVLEK